MNRPHYLLISAAQDDTRAQGGHWQFLLQSLDQCSVLEVSDRERQAQGERLELLAVVRGLEALGQPSRVTLLTTSRCVDRGLRHRLNAWRANGWQWERYGRLEPIKNADLWQRIDRALEYHEVECRTVPLPLGRCAARPARPLPAAGHPQAGPQPGWRGRWQAVWHELADRFALRPARSLAS